MNQQMWHATATQDNITILRQRDVTIWGPGAGEQACGDIGLGRMLDVDDLVTHTCNFFSQNNKTLKSQHWVITAGPTREAIDPVRYISNHSSGKMGYAIATAAANAGATVTVLSGPVNLPNPNNCKVIKVNSALEMHKQALNLAKNADIFVACAAVADYRIAEIAEQKIKKSGDEMQLTLIKNPDIVADVTALSTRPFTVGFAAETQDVEQYALGKLKKKNLDMIAANNVATQGQGFNSDNNALTVFTAHSQSDIPLASKQLVAEQLVDLINHQQQISKTK
jgi:phosphopantothenoylcysteine decarboxylase/phosphopantothenate--cysteine ligase